MARRTFGLPQHPTTGHKRSEGGTEVQMAERVIGHRGRAAGRRYLRNSGGTPLAQPLNKRDGARGLAALRAARPDGVLRGACLGELVGFLWAVTREGEPVSAT